MGHWTDRTISFDQIDFAALPLRIDTARYTCPDFQRRDADGKLNLPEGTTPRTTLQQATRR